MIVIVIIAIYLTLVGFIGLASRRDSRRDSSIQDFAVAGSSLTTPVLFASISATYIGPGFSIGFVGEGTQSAYVYLLCGIAYGLQTVFVGTYIAPKLRKLHECYSLGDVFDRLYGNVVRNVSAVLAVGLMIGFSAVMAKAGGVLLSTVTGWPEIISVILVVGLTVSYTTAGGLRASVYTDVFQFITFSALFAYLFYAMLSSAVKSDSAQSVIIHAMNQSLSGFSEIGIMGVISLVMAFLFGEMLIPPYAVRALAGKSNSTTQKAFIIAGLYAPVWFFLVLTIGFLAQFYPNVARSSDDTLVLNLMQAFLPGIGYAIGVAILLGVIMSSLDSLLNAGASGFARDFLLLSKGRETKQFEIARIATVAIGVGAVVIAYRLPTVLKGLLLIYSVWAPTIIPSLLLGLALKRRNAFAAFASMITGGGLSLILETGGFTKHFNVPAMLVSMSASVVMYLCMHSLFLLVKRFDVGKT